MPKCLAANFANRRDKTVSEATEVAHGFELIYKAPRSQRMQVASEFEAFFFEVPNLVTCRHILTEWSTTLMWEMHTQQHFYQVSPEKRKYPVAKVRYMLDNGIAVPVSSSWASPYLLVPNMYLGNLVIYSNSWHRALKHRLTSSPRLTVNLAKCEFVYATVTYFTDPCVSVCGRVMAVRQLPQATAKKELMRFLRMVGYCRCFCQNFSSLVAPVSKS